MRDWFAPPPPCPYATKHEKGPESARYCCCEWRFDGKAKCARQRWDQAERRKETSAYRVFPGPPHAGAPRGRCQWCGEAITTKNADRRGWHDGREHEPDCLHQHYLHTRLDNQVPFLLGRDGVRCAQCRAPAGRWESTLFRPDAIRDPDELRQISAAWVKHLPPDIYVGPYVPVDWKTALEVDHKVALRLVAHLPPEERRAYFGPINLWLLCHACHLTKTREDLTKIASLKETG